MRQPERYKVLDNIESWPSGGLSLVVDCPPYLLPPQIVTQLREFWPSYDLRLAYEVKNLATRLEAQNRMEGLTWPKVAEKFLGVDKTMRVDEGLIQWMSDNVIEKIEPSMFKQVLVFELVKQGQERYQYTRKSDSSLIHELLTRVLLNGSLAVWCELLSGNFPQLGEYISRMVTGEELLSLEERLMCPVNATCLGLYNPPRGELLIFNGLNSCTLANRQKPLYDLELFSDLGLNGSIGILGIDGTGKTSVSNLLLEMFRQNGDDYCVVDIGHPYRGNASLFEELGLDLSDSDLSELKCIDEAIHRELANPNYNNSKLQDLFFQSRIILWRILAKDSRKKIFVRVGLDGAAYQGEDPVGFIQSLQRELEAVHLADLNYIIQPPIKVVMQWLTDRQQNTGQGDVLDTLSYRDLLARSLNYAIISDILGPYSSYLRILRREAGGEYTISTLNAIASSIYQRATRWWFDFPEIDELDTCQLVFSPMFRVERVDVNIIFFV